MPRSATKSPARLRPSVSQPGPASAAPQRSGGSGQTWIDAAAFAVILTLAFIAYFPALNGTLLWDDEAHIIAPELQSLHGLHRIWFDLGATQQYYPLLHSAFWLEHLLWGDSTTPYHVLNVLLHSICAWLLVLIVRRLEIASAWLAGAVFALHPVCVEAVAWISEQKSTLSGVFCLGAALLYLDFDRTRRRSRYFAALALFVCALLSKSVTATLPAALLVVLWWKRSKLDAKRDVFPLVPWLAFGAASGLFTAWVERHIIHAEGADFALTLTDRFLLAGRVPWLYLLHIVWPVNLSFFYPRFTVDSRDPLQYLFPAGTILALAGLTILARTRRGPLAAALLFVGTLFPALGFFNVYPFRYSWVADHFSYLASIAVIVPLCALLTHLGGTTEPVAAGQPKVTDSRERRSGPVPPARRLPGRAPTVAACFLVAVLGLLTWRQSHGYTDIETLWRTTIERTPSAWMPHYELGVLLENDPARRAEAISEFRTELRYRPEHAPGHAELAAMLEPMPGGRAEALTEYQTALRLDPSFAMGHNNYGVTLSHDPQRLPDAIVEFETAIRLDPRLFSARNNLALALARIPSRAGEAEAQARTAIAIDPSAAQAHNLLGILLVRSPERADEGVAEFQTALRLDPGYREARLNIANALGQQPGRLPDAIAEYQTLLRAWPNDTTAHLRLAITLARLPDQREAAISEFETVLGLNPDITEAHYDLALLLSTVPGRMPDAVAHLEAAQRLDPDSAQVNQMLARLHAIGR
jgi:protein O-mannosyl-transferase